MAFKHGLSERLDELRFPSPRSPPSDSTFPGYSPLSPGTSNFTSNFSGFSRPATDIRANLQRRFTTDSSKLSSWSYLNQGVAPGRDPMDLLSSFEKKRKHIESMREQKRRFEQDMKELEMQHQQEQNEMDKLAERLARQGLSGRASEPTTPPEHAVQSRPDVMDNFNNITSTTSSPGVFNTFGTPSNLTSPQAPTHLGHAHAQSVDFTGSSLPASRRNSERQDFGVEPITTTTGLRPARLSLPSSNLSGSLASNPLYNPGLRRRIDSYAPRNVFDNERAALSELANEGRLSTPDVEGYISMTEPVDRFPTLRGDASSLSANQDAFQIANSRTPAQDPFHNSHRRNRSSHQSMPQNFAPMSFGMSESYERASPPHRVQPHHQPHRSLESSYNLPGQFSAGAATPVHSSGRPVALQSSYSTNDVPTVSSGFETNPPVLTQTQTHSGAHHRWGSSISMGQAPIGSYQPESSRASPETATQSHQQLPGPNPLQPSALPFGPQQYTSPYAGTYGTTVTPYPPGGQQIPSYPTYQRDYPANVYGDVPSRAVPVQRRGGDGDAAQNRFNNTPIEQHIGQIHNMCRDQYGCRYLQRKLEERNPEVFRIIFNETFHHVQGLMTDPFGNYLCQKLLEFANNEQRTILINNAAPQLVDIALNQHGTRALQKMIEYISTQEQISTVIQALQNHVVDLVQDLNGNHVIQKCLTRLRGDNAEFIYTAVGRNCVRVGTHRHGCCVIQRCIDHATDSQKERLIRQITESSIRLVQDAYGNYVVQYILDLDNPFFTTRLCHRFYGQIPQLSKQKFSSNVIEKCLRKADSAIRTEMIREMLNENELERMLRDSFANYVIQTAMENSVGDTRWQLHDLIRTKLHLVRNTPHGRRIASKLAAFENENREGPRRGPHGGGGFGGGGGVGGGGSSAQHYYQGGPGWSSPPYGHLVVATPPQGGVAFEPPTRGSSEDGRGGQEMPTQDPSRPF